MKFIMVRNVLDFWDELEGWQKEEYKRVLEKYKDDPWWESDNPVYVLKHQIEEPWPVISVPDYLGMLEKFLERPVCHLDFGFNYQGLQEEVRLAIKRKEQGVGISDEQREEACRRYSERIKRIVDEKFPKGKLMKINLPNTPNMGDQGIGTSGYDGWL